MSETFREKLFNSAAVQSVIQGTRITLVVAFGAALSAEHTSGHTKEELRDMPQPELNLLSRQQSKLTFECFREKDSSEQIIGCVGKEDPHIREHLEQTIEGVGKSKELSVEQGKKVTLRMIAGIHPILEAMVKQKESGKPVSDDEVRPGLNQIVLDTQEIEGLKNTD